MEPRKAAKKWAELLMAVGITHIKLHGARHTFATVMLQKNVDAKVVSHYLGHTDISTTQNIYQHVNTLVTPMDSGSTSNTVAPKTILNIKHKKAVDGSLRFLQLRIFQRLKRSLSAAQSKVTAHVQMEEILSGSKSELMKSPTLASFHSLSNG